MQSQEPNQTNPNPSQSNQPQDDSAAVVPAISGSIPPASDHSPNSSSNQAVVNNFQSNSQAASSLQVPDDASDADLIEKEWVVKAKDIVNHTQNNPFEQQKALSKFKADYMKKRYNKDIKIEDA